MSFVTSVLALNMAVSQRNNAAFGVHQNHQALQSMLTNSGKMPPEKALAAEKKITFGSMQNALLYKINSILQESYKKKLDKDIKDSFSTFA